MEEIFIPAKTADKLNGEHPKGTRHQAKIDICMSLLGNGISPIAVEQTLVEKFPQASLPEIQGVIRWCLERRPTPSGYGRTATGQAPTYRPAPPVQKTVQPARTHTEQCDWWLNGKTALEQEVYDSSPIQFKGTPKEILITFFETMYGADEKLNIVCKYTMRETKANPQGGGKVMTRVEWCEYIRSSGVPQSDAGAWLRMNPCRSGSGASGAVTDADVTAWRFVLLESDTVAPETLMAFFQNLKLPIAAILKSGGKSVHGWLRVDCQDENAYSEITKRVLETLEPFGIDKANKNPSRLSRLPSAHRVIQGSGDGMQSLLYLNPSAKPFKMSDAEELVSRLSVPLADEVPMRTLFHQAVSRYEDLYNNRGNLGVQFGFTEFDRDTGGLKGGQMTTIAAETNKGKSTVLLNLIYGALLRGTGAALFTLEMDREEIVDLLASIHCGINRNAFNTGYFSDSEMALITSKMHEISKLKLWIFDDAVMTVSDMEKRIESLKGKIGIVGVDYLQIVTARNQMVSREQQVAEIARDLRIAAKRHRLPVIVLSQLNDDGKLRESRVVGHESHNVIQVDIEEGVMKVVKGRRIPKKEYKLTYEREFARVTMPLIAHETDPNNRD